ncbi:MAG: hypothetical protein NVSMB12_17970 [Acidimicrobiales bacterium]
MPLLASLDIADPAAVWTDLGFAVTDGASVVDGVRHRQGAAGKGIVGWALWGATMAPEQDQIEGLPTVIAPGAPPAPLTPVHPNGVTGLDHVVVFTPDLPRSIAAFEAAGMELRRTRDTGGAGGPMRQAFFRLGPVILEVVGPEEASGEGPARFFGLAWTCDDLDATVRWLGDRLPDPKAAVQEGRRISTLTRDSGSTVAMAFMSR